MKKIVSLLLSGLLCFSFVFTSCNSGNSSDDDKKPAPDPAPVEPSDNPVIGTRTESLNFIFNPDVLGSTTITIKRSDWNKMCQYYDWWEKNETCVPATYTFEKNDKKWEFKNVGVRIRGNTSRKRPQDKESGKYVQAHFKVDLEEYSGDTEVKMSDAMKGVILKRFRNDPSYIGEVFGYNFFRDNGVWTAPRAAFTKLTVKIIESDESVKTVNYGMYEMVEEINKQYLKERTTAETGGSYSNNKGNLWKCAWALGEYGWTGASMRTDQGAKFGVEYKEFTDESGNYEEKTYSYDLKTNKDKLSDATTEIKTFMNELNNLSNGSTDAKNWFESKMDVDFFLKTYAINVILGMWDDYWTNMNNYYFYFDKAGKSYFIPYDYDNILAIATPECNNENPATRNPLEWGYCNCSNGDRPLIDKILSVSDFKKKYVSHLKTLVNTDYYSNVVSKLTAWQTLISPYVSSSDLLRKDTTDTIEKTAAQLASYFADKKSTITSLSD